MRVKYEHPKPRRNWASLTLGREYLVLGISDQSYRVLNDYSEPILYPRECFEVIDSRIPEDWNREDYDEGEYYIDPVEVAKPGFYEDYFDGVREVQEIFWRVLSREKKRYS